MRAMKRIVTLVLALAMVFGMTGCGKVTYDEITGEWTTSTINGIALAAYAEGLGVSTKECSSTFKITEDNKIVVSDSSQSVNYVYERKLNGIEVKEEGKDEILFSMVYDDDEKTLSYEVDLGNDSNMKIVLTKTTAQE